MSASDRVMLEQKEEIATLRSRVAALEAEREAVEAVLKAIGDKRTELAPLVESDAARTYWDGRYDAFQDAAMWLRAALAASPPAPASAREVV